MKSLMKIEYEFYDYVKERFHALLKYKECVTKSGDKRIKSNSPQLHTMFMANKSTVFMRFTRNMPDYCHARASFNFFTL